MFRDTLKALVANVIIVCKLFYIGVVSNKELKRIAEVRDNEGTPSTRAQLLSSGSLKYCEALCLLHRRVAN